MSDQTAAANLEITTALAEAAEDLLRDFAENAELEVALVVDHSGGLIAGISADDEVSVETVGALVAGTIGSIRALGKAVGETKALESMHHGEETTIYLRELNERFIIVGSAESGVPAGIIREVGARISKPLLAVLLGEEIVEASVSEEVDFKDEAVEEVGDENQIELTETSDPHHELPEDAEEEENSAVEEQKLPIPTLVVDSPFEFVDDDDLDEEVDAAAEEEEEGIAANGMVFEMGVDDDSDSPEVEDAEVEDAEVEDGDNDEPELIFELGDDDDDDGQDSDGEVDDDGEMGVAAPLLVAPMIPTSDQIKIEIEEDATTSVAAITTPIATDIIKKKNVSAPAPEEATPTASESTDSNDVEEEVEDSNDDDDEPVGGPRYVFEIG